MKKTILTIGVISTLLFTGCYNENKAQNTQQPISKKSKKDVMSNYRAVPASKATILQKGDQKMYCPVCGMTLPLFYRTNHAASHNGYDKQYCSIHCAAQDKEVNKKMLANFRVVDNDTLEFIDSNDAFFVVGSKKPGTMSTVSKYAFGTQESAKEFKNRFGGKVMKFSELYILVKESLKDDIKKVEAKQTMAAKKGSMIYKKMCKQIDTKFESVSQAKAYIKKNKICGNLKGKKLQMVGLYLGKE
ncbi:MAG: nitrous oxide reductase accessory protein NosL [Campylobacterota bacterium]|nr:nitrous oxide reductase accessory protein NosL [Campylobacterota bacterium]